MPTIATKSNFCQLDMFYTSFNYGENISQTLVSTAWTANEKTQILMIETIFETFRLSETYNFHKHLFNKMWRKTKITNKWCWSLLQRTMQPLASWSLDIWFYQSWNTKQNLNFPIYDNTFHCNASITNQIKCERNGRRKSCKKWTERAIFLV